MQKGLQGQVDTGEGREEGLLNELEREIISLAKYRYTKTRLSKSLSEIMECVIVQSLQNATWTYFRS